MIKDLINIFKTKTKALEILYLLENIKPVVRQGFYKNELKAIKKFCKTNNLSIKISPYKIILINTKENYSNKGIKINKNDPRLGMFFVYISKNKQKAIKARDYEAENDHKKLGSLLGYPNCCIDFFIKHNKQEYKKDYDYKNPILKNSNDFNYLTNIFKRNKDITLLNHFPCSLNCKNSIRLAKKHLDIIKKYNKKLANLMIKELKNYSS